MSEIAKKPTCQCNDMYQVGNDYCQKDVEFVASSYADGIYTELSGTASAWEGPDSPFNKYIRIDRVNAPYSAADYATASVVEEVNELIPEDK